MRYWLHVLSWLLLLCLYSYTASAQEYSYARYDVKDGLAGSVVYHGVEDKDGFLWFATETGVSRFDGTHFRNFTMADGLPDNEIIKLFVDSKDRVWMMPFRNSICYYWKGKIYNQENDSLLRKLSVTGQITSIVEDRQGNLMLVDLATIYFLTADQEVHLWNGTTLATARVGGLNAAGHFTSLLQNGDSAFIADFSPRGELISKEAFSYWPLSYQVNHLLPRLQVYWHEDSVLFASGPRKVINTLRVPENFNNLSVINDSLCYINTGNGAVFFDIKKNKALRHVLRGKNVNAVFQDKEENTWFLTAGAGIFRVGSFGVSNFTFTENNKDYLAIFSINKFDSLIYAGSEKALLYTIDGKRQTVTPHYVVKKAFNLRVLFMTQLRQQLILLGTNSGIYTIKGTSWTKGELAVKSMHIDGNKLLVSMQHALLLVTRNAHKIVMGNARSTCSYVQDKLYYNGTLNGLYTIDSTGKITWLGDQHKQLRSRITDIEVAPDGTLWIATHGNGLIGYKAGKVLYSIRQQNGLTSDICRTVFIAGSDIWLGTDKGLNRVRWHDGRYTITSYNTADGLLSDIINAIYVDGSQVYVGTPAGLTTFDEEKISSHSFCKLRMTSMQAAGQAWHYDTTGFVLPPANNAIRFDYVGISYRSAGDITYRYRMVGLNDNWQTTRETFLSYPALPSGDYELQLKATNKFGVESDMVRIPFRVEKLLWEKAWFRILALVVAWILIWTFVNARIKKVRRQNDEKMQINNRMAELEQMALKAQMNPHFIFNSLNSVQQYVIDKDLLGANKFITEFSRLIRLTLDISSKTKISIYEEISYLTTYLELEKTKFEDKFSYGVELDHELDPSDWFIPPMILQPYVENSIRHGVRYRHDKLGHIKLCFRLSEQYLICQVEDNGVGRQKAGQYKSEMPIEYQSKGMTLTARRIDMLNQNQANPVFIDIEDLYSDDVPAGTRVSIHFPTTDAHA